MIVTLICVSSGGAFGLLTGLILFCLQKHDKLEHFTDETYWIDPNESEDGSFYGDREEK